MNRQQTLDYYGAIDLLTAVVRQARKDAKRGDRDAAHFLHSMGAPADRPIKTTPIRQGEAIAQITQLIRNKGVTKNARQGRITSKV